jgi:hypothetical protein
MKCKACGMEVIDITAHVFQCKITKARVEARLAVERAKARAARRKLKDVILPRLMADKSRFPITFRLEKPDRARHALVTVDIARLDRAWRLTDSYITQQGGIDDRFVRLAAWIGDRPGKPIPAPKVYLKDERSLPSFDDGRRRFALSRDLGYRTIKLAVPRKQVGQFRRAFGPNVSKPRAKPKRATGVGAGGSEVPPVSATH